MAATIARKRLARQLRTVAGDLEGKDGMALALALAASGRAIVHAATDAAAAADEADEDDAALFAAHLSAVADEAARACGTRLATGDAGGEDALDSGDPAARRNAYADWLAVDAAALGAFERAAGEPEQEKLARAMHARRGARYRELVERLEDGLRELDGIVAECVEASDEDRRAVEARAARR